MKKVFGIVLIVSMLLVDGTRAQDTVHYCAYADTSLNQVPYFLLLACPGGNPFAYIFNGDTTIGLWKLKAGTEGILKVYCYDSFGNYDWIPDTVVYFIGNTQPMICVITSDSNNHPVVHTDTSTRYGNYPISLQRQVSTLSWQTVAIIKPGDPQTIMDSSANTATQSYHYRLESATGSDGTTGNCRGVDPYGNSLEHWTIHLQASGNNLIWNEYRGASLRGYYIHKRDSSGNFPLIDSTASLTYTDLNFHDGDEYFVEAFKEDGCPPVEWLKMGTTISVKSNTLMIGTTSIRIPEQIRFKYAVEGNTLHIELEKPDDVGVHDLLGREIIHERTDKLSVQLNTGIYLLNVGAKGQKITIH